MIVINFYKRTDTLGKERRSGWAVSCTEKKASGISRRRTGAAENATDRWRRLAQTLA
jgi:hypothetical protein